MPAVSHKHTILIVDDEPHILSSLKRILEGQGKEILLAKDAEAAWSMLKEGGEVEVILCDNKLPGVSGVDFLIKVKRLYPDTIRILITGYPDLGSAMDAINRAHIWRYMLKPVEVEELKVLVKQAFDYYAILRENRTLLKIVRHQLERFKSLEERHPQVMADQAKGPAGEEEKMQDVIKELMKKYYPRGG